MSAGHLYTSTASVKCVLVKDAPGLIARNAGFVAKAAGYSGVQKWHGAKSTTKGRRKIATTLLIIEKMLMRIALRCTTGGKPERS